MKTVLYITAAMLCFAISNVTIEHKLSKFNNLTIMVCYAAIITVSALILRSLTMTSDPSFSFPTGGYLVAVAATGILFTIGDYFFIGAYTAGGSSIVIAAMTLTFPVFVCLIKFGLARQLPNPWQLAAFVFGAVAVLCAAKGTPALGK